MLALAAPACDFQKDPDPGPAAVSATRLVTIRVEYRQPAGCLNADSIHCDDRVVFFGSWMRPRSGSYDGDQVLLDTRFGPNFWAGSVPNVPVNWPPNDFPHYVRVFDPHLRDTPSGGVTAARLTIGGQVVTTTTRRRRRWRAGSSTSTTTGSAAARTERGRAPADGPRAARG